MSLTNVDMIVFICRSVLSRCRGLYKVGRSHLSVGNYQHAQHYFEQALGFCEEEFSQLKLDIQVCIPPLSPPPLCCMSLLCILCLSFVVLYVFQVVCYTG